MFRVLSTLQSAKLDTDETFLWLAQNIWCNSSTTRPHTCLSSACQHHAEITQSHTIAALIRLSTTTHNILTFNTSEISSNNSEKLSLLADKHTLTFLLHSSYSSSRMQSHTVGRPVKSLFSHQKKQKVLVRVKVRLQFCSHLIHLTPKSLFPRPKTWWSPQKNEQYRTFLSQPGLV